MRPASWVPAVLWMAVILGLASDTASAERTGRIIGPILRALFPGASPLEIQAMHGMVRNLAHAVEYGVLSALWLRALVRDGVAGRRPAAWIAWAIAAAWAVIDETYQATVGSRTGSALDVMIDATGALIVAIVGGYGWPPTADRVTRLLLWIAALGGAGLLTINVLAGVDTGLLWLTAPVAVFALLLLYRRRPGGPPTP